MFLIGINFKFARGRYCQDDLDQGAAAVMAMVTWLLLSLPSLTTKVNT
jgi:hypothetical protein